MRPPLETGSPFRYQRKARPPGKGAHSVTFSSAKIAVTAGRAFTVTVIGADGENVSADDTDCSSPNAFVPRT